MLVFSEDSFRKEGLTCKDEDFARDVFRDVFRRIVNIQDTLAANSVQVLSGSKIDIGKKGYGNIVAATLNSREDIDPKLKESFLRKIRKNPIKGKYYAKGLDDEKLCLEVKTDWEEASFYVTKPGPKGIYGIENSIERISVRYLDILKGRSLADHFLHEAGNIVLVFEDERNIRLAIDDIAKIQEQQLAVLEQSIQEKNNLYFF